KNPRPVLVECLTFRMRGHEEASGTKYVPQHLFDEWIQKDPVKNFEDYLLDQGILTEQLISETRQSFKKQIDSEIEAAFAEPEPQADAKRELSDMYYPYHVSQFAPQTSSSEKRYLDA